MVSEYIKGKFLHLIKNTCPLMKIRVKLVYAQLETFLVEGKIIYV